MSEQEEGSAEKSFDASETKIRQSREKGDAPQSTEAHTLLLYMGLALAILALGGTSARKIHTYLSAMLERPEDVGDSILFMQGNGGVTLGQSEIFWQPFMALAGVFAILIVAVAISVTVQRAFTFSPDKIKFKLSRISPISNAKQKYGQKGMVEFFKRMFKLAFITVLAIIFMTVLLRTLPGKASIASGQVLSMMRDTALQLVFLMILALIAITLMDLPYARFAFLKNLRMTFQEVRDEAKENEGDPHMKSARRAQARAISQSTMLNDVAKADVIIVNPTHYAVALEWDRTAGTVPSLLAKGTDELARRIRERAKEHNIAIYSDPPCARSIHALVEVGEFIRPEHYAAVAASIHFADSLTQKGY